MKLQYTAAYSAKLLTLLRRELRLSSGLISRLKWKGAFFVNGVCVHTDYPVKPGDEVCVILDEQTEGYPPEPMALSIVYEDESCIILDKPAGMLVHPSSNRNTGTLANGLACYYEQSGQKCGVHPVTRLDRDTFGLVLAAKNAHIHALFCALLRERKIEKTYYASVFGCPAQSGGRITLPIARCGGGSLLRTVEDGGQSAVTDYRVLDCHSRTALLELHPLTGRTHQLRLHCLASGFPILGDPQYCSPPSEAFSRAEGIFPQQLCAAVLRFSHPLTGRPVLAESSQKVRFP